MYEIGLGLEKMKVLASQLPLHGPPSIGRHKPQWWRPREIHQRAIKEFDTEHRQNLHRVERLHGALCDDPSSLRKGDALILARVELARHRYIERDKLEGVRRYAKREKPKKQ